MHNHGVILFIPSSCKIMLLSNHIVDHHVMWWLQGPTDTLRNSDLDFSWSLVFAWPTLSSFLLRQKVSTTEAKPLPANSGNYPRSIKSWSHPYNEKRSRQSWIQAHLPNVSKGGLFRMEENVYANEWQSQLVPLWAGMGRYTIGRLTRSSCWKTILQKLSHQWWLHRSGLRLAILREPK